jgi:hypothetical protein
MLAGELYDASDPELVAERLRARALCQRLAALDPAAPEDERAGLLTELFGAPTDAYVTPPFFCDYGATSSSGGASTSISIASSATSRRSRSAIASSSARRSSFTRRPTP